MSYPGPRRAVLPRLSNRTLRHPSFLPLYVAAGSARPGRGEGRTAHPIIPAELFYTDPTMHCGRRIPNMLSGLRGFDCSLLNTPPPIMSTCLAPPNCPDPFRSGPHPTRDLGSPAWKINTVLLQVQPRRAVIELTQEEDRAITNLLQLHHQEQSDENLTDAPNDCISVVDLLVFRRPTLKDSLSAEEEYKPVCFDVKYLREVGWSDTELEAANTLLSGFNLKGDVQNQHKTEKILPVPLLSQRIETQQECDALQASVTSDCTQNDTGRVGQNGDIWFVEDRTAGDCCQDNLASPVLALNSKTKSRWSVSGGCLEIKEAMLSDLEVDAVDVLLNLCDVGILDIVQ